MSNETSKCYEQRIENGTFEKYLNGKGIDIGCGTDCLNILDGEVQPYDSAFGRTEPGELIDAQFMEGIENNAFDFVYSSHCLEHTNDPEESLHNWIRICKPGGYIYVIVPDAFLYENNIWPSKFAGELHKWSFTIEDLNCKITKNIILVDFLKKFDIELVDIFINDLNYDYKLSKKIDQTMRGACAHIEFILRKNEK